ncbi:hypothetical protein, conserved [Cyanidioschyzon merolae strain 10D]|uniref:Transmembrane protein 120 n=1 Tax=Cyanidioschyzon merolae (strain NIES-3377 / 10D) TaxID=280699 RepID=M1VGR6_CYAM1|nr:hypothetical protein, conserved [Cyanidioschyzon merolae strain 10D]BAM79918.1 hypothetical protein, conserved [Cyanidioschyzon merolae strain 10D]|eukprot:XP_005536204.1 hypothetical protein, conserved [Cyanidioschyzon merolae strain 10D]
MVVEVGAAGEASLGRRQAQVQQDTRGANSEPAHVVSGGRAQDSTASVAQASVQEERTSPLGAELNELERANGELEKTVNEYGSLIERYTKLQQQLCQLAAKQQKRLVHLERTLANQRETMRPRNNSPDLRQETRAVLERSRKLLRERVEPLLPSDGGWFVRLFLGTINVRFMDKRTRLSFKREYEQFKQQTAPALVIASVVCLLWTSSRWPSLLLQMFIAYYYSALALRESVLVANGSNIRRWWRLHHYLSLVLAVVVLTWPDGEAYAEFRGEIHFLGLYLSLLQILQARYQMSRLYTLRSLGKAGELDVANTDSPAQLHWGANMSLLLPAILVAHALQAWTAVRAFQVYFKYPRVAQALLGGTITLITCIGNVVTTFRTLREKAVLSGQHASS